MPAGGRRSAPKASAARPRGWTVRSRRPIGKGSLGIVMRFHDVCGRLVAHPLHENRLPGDTPFKNPHRPSKAAGLETPVTLTANGSFIYTPNNNFNGTDLKH